MNKFYLCSTKQGTDTKYFVAEIAVQKHTHPRYISRCIDERAESLGLKSVYGWNLVATWTGDLYAELAAAEQKLTKGGWIASYTMQLKETVKTLSVAAEVLKSNSMVGEINA
jgi:hypothetical protein